MPKMLDIGQCLTELFKKNNTGTVFWDTMYIHHVPIWNGSHFLSC